MDDNSCWHTDNIEELPGILRTGACMAPRINLIIDAERALRLARRIEDGAQVVVVEREMPPGGATVVLLLASVAVWVFAAMVPAALFIAGLF